MSEAENNTQRSKTKTSPMAIASSTCVGLYIVIMFTVALSHIHELFKIFFGLLALSSLIMSPILGFIAKRNIKQSNGTLVGNFSANTGITVSIIIFILSFAMPMLQTMKQRAYRTRYWTTYIRYIGLDMEAYAEDNERKYPTPNKWCDILNNYIYDEPIDHPTNNKNKCNFATNPKCTPDSPPDTVLIFETESGWNQFGQAEMLYFENHNKKGCNILFNDRSVKFIEPNNLDNLNWGD